MSGFTNRRVVTGLDAAGKSCVSFDGPMPRPDPLANIVWRTTTLPAINSGAHDEAGPFTAEKLHDGGANFILAELPPGSGDEVFMHATDTQDYIVMISGELVMVLECGEVTLHPGDLIVDRGVLHGWRNDGPEAAIYATVTVPSYPVGAGRTVGL